MISMLSLTGGYITSEELTGIVMKMKKKKAPGWDYNSAECLKYSGPLLRKTLTLLINAIIRKESIPVHCKRGLIVSIPKAGKNPVIKDNNRGIALVPVIYKVIEKLDK